MRTMLNSLFVVAGMSAAFVAGFWTRDQIAFYRDASKDTRYRPTYNWYAFGNNDYHNGYRSGYSNGFREGRAESEREKELKEEYGEEVENEDI